MPIHQWSELSNNFSDCLLTDPVHLDDEQVYRNGAWVVAQDGR